MPRRIRPALAAVATLLASVLPAHAGPQVTVYSRDLGFVRETRGYERRAATDTLRFEDVPLRIDFASVRLVPEDPAQKVARLAWRFDVADADRLLERARGGRVSVTSRGERTTEGELLASGGGWLVLRGDDGTVTQLSREAVEAVRLTRPPAGLALRPAIEAVLEGGRRGRAEAQLSYLTGGLSWSAEHVVVRRGEGAARWSSAVTVENTTGRDFHDATLKLVAGEPRRAGPSPKGMMAMARTMADEASAEATLSQEAFSEYHLYTLPGTATLRDREMQALTMLEPRDIKVSPRYLYRAAMDPSGVTSQLEIRNESAAGLGVPLPGGRVRFYEADASGALQFTGETRNGHVAAGEKMTLDVGRAFDLVAERRDLFTRRISDREREYGVEVKLRNRKKTDVRIVVEEPVGGDTELIKQSHPSTRKDAGTIQFEIAVPAGQEVVVSYTARARW